MKYIRSKLSRQLLSIIVIIFGIIFLSLGIFLPNSILPILEKNIYNYLRQPLDFIDEDIESSSITTEIGYIYMYNDASSVSANFFDVVKTKNLSEVLQLLNGKYGKFLLRGKTYYYYTSNNNAITRIAITDDNYIVQIKGDILYQVFPVILLTLAAIALTLIFWSGRVVKKIEKLKQKIDHIDDDDYDHTVDPMIDDEIKSLELAVEDMRVSLKNQEEYRNQMYQNISHDFKTPLTVIKSYIEAVEDGVEDKDKALTIIEEQTNKLEQKVHSLLYLNKLDYIKDFKGVSLEQIDVTELLHKAVEKFKFQRKDVNFVIKIDKNTKFLGTIDSWETVIDNILGNFIRYADKEIKVTVKKNQLVFYNDGPNIEENFLEGIFIPFRKGMKGEFGLGLSIVKKTLNFMSYDVAIKNHNKKGVSFVITKGPSK